MERRVEGSVTEVSPVQFINVESEIDVTEAGIVIVVNLVQFANAFASIWVMELGMLIAVSSWQFWKEALLRMVVEAGMVNSPFLVEGHCIKAFCFFSYKTPSTL